MTADLLVILLMYFSALAWGSNQPWAMGLIILLATSILAASILRQLWRDRPSLEPGSVYVPLLLFLGYGALQLLRSPIDLKEALSWLPMSVERHSTLLYLLLALAYVGVVYCIHHGFRTRGRVQALILAVLALGIFEALYGLFQYLAQHNYIWDYETRGHYARGTFINRNHYALFLNLSICAGVGYLYYRSHTLLEEKNVTLRRIVSSPRAGKLLWILILVGLMGLALIFSLSRMGMGALFGSVIVMAMASYCARRGRGAAAIVVGLLFIIGSLAVYTGIDVVLARFEVLTVEYLEKDRLPIWRDALRLVEQNPLLGHGLGTFRWTYPAFESFEPDTPARYAHNDYLQALAEVGILGLSLLIWAFISCWKVAAHNLVHGREALVRGIGLATLGALAATALQEWTDFSLYIPGVALTFATLIGLNLRAARLQAESHQKASGESRPSMVS